MEKSRGTKKKEKKTNKFKQNAFLLNFTLHYFSEVKSMLTIRVGDLNNKDPDSDEEEFEIEEIYMHEEYDGGFILKNIHGKIYTFNVE